MQQDLTHKGEAQENETHTFRCQNKMVSHITHKTSNLQSPELVKFAFSQGQSPTHNPMQTNNSLPALPTIKKGPIRPPQKAVTPSPPSQKMSSTPQKWGSSDRSTFFRQFFDIFDIFFDIFSTFFRHFFFRRSFRHFFDNFSTMFRHFSTFFRRFSTFSTFSFRFPKNPTWSFRPFSTFFRHFFGIFSTIFRQFFRQFL